MKIPVIINNRNLLTWPKAMLEEIKRFENVGDIWIVDNASTYGPLVEWMSGSPCKILRLAENMGHTAPWFSGLIHSLKSEYYVVTDGDLDLSNIPDDILRVLKDKLDNSPSLGKIGLGLDWRSVPNTSPYFNHMLKHEQLRWKKSEVINDVFVDIAVDTTFALYNRPDYFIGGGSLSHPYVARHIPWEIVDINENQEFKFYIENASKSSSYKTFLGL